jgi:hypothetical protein
LANIFGGTFLLIQVTGSLDFFLKEKKGVWGEGCRWRERERRFDAFEFNVTTKKSFDII